MPKKTKIEISPEERDLLKAYLKASPLILIRLKCYAILTKEKGMNLSGIADIVSRHENTIGMWMKDWEKQRMASIFTGHKGNHNASKLTKEQKEEIREALAKPPSDYAIPKTFWDVPAIKTYVQAIFGVVFDSIRSYHFLLSFCNLSFKYPDTFDLHRNETQIAERMAEIKTEIDPFLRDDSWEVFASDEVRMELEAFTRKAWLKKGERTILEVNRKREAQSYLGLLNQKNFRCHLYEVPWQNQEEILKALKQFLKEYPDKKICIIWDNARFHKGKEIREALSKGGLLERVHLINLPPYAPDRNPIEHVWNTAKGMMANTQYESFEKMKSVFFEHVNGRIFEYRI